MELSVKSEASGERGGEEREEGRWGWEREGGKQGRIWRGDGEVMEEGVEYSERKMRRGREGRGRRGPEDS
jgi:hypothetical protein